MSKISDKLNDKWHTTKPVKKRRISAVLYAIVLVAVFGAIGMNYQSPSGLGDGAISPLGSSQNALINQVRESNLAVAAADTASLSIANNVMERSISLATKEEMSQSDDTVISKPILSIDDSNSSLITYVSVEGDTVASVARKFGVSTQTVKWANNLVNDLLGLGTSLTIPIVDGVVYTFKDGDTIESVADKYKGSSAEIFAQNNITATIKAGDVIIIPGGILPTNERPGYTVPVARPSTSTSTSTSYSDSAAMVGNRYSYGYCTWYAYNRRAALGNPIASFWGNANTWDNRARAAGWTVSTTPIAGAVFQTDAGYYGHVGVVESVNEDGTINISDMNGIAGWNRVGYANGVSGAGYVYIY